MSKTKKVLDLTRKEPLIDRQRSLWGHSEAIELAQIRGEPLPKEVSEWLHRALKNIACGEDANEVLMSFLKNVECVKMVFCMRCSRNSRTVTSQQVQRKRQMEQSQKRLRRQ